jgi:hypothetical protein
MIQDIITASSPHFTFISLAGVDLLRALLWTRVVDFYIAHHGTVHHKIAWFSDAPGIVHAGRGTVPDSFMITTLHACQDRPVPNYVWGSVGRNDSSVNDGRKDLFSYYLGASELFAAIAPIVRERLRSSPLSISSPARKEFISLSRSEYLDDRVRQILKSGFRAWAAGNAPLAFDEFANAFKEAPFDEQINAALLSIVTSHYVCSEGVSPENRVGALEFFLKLNPGHRWAVSMLLEAYAQVSDHAGINSLIEDPNNATFKEELKAWVRSYGNPR